MKRSKKKRERRALREGKDHAASGEALQFTKLALRYGYLSVILGVFSAPFAFYYAHLADSLLVGAAHAPGRRRTKEARTMAIFGVIVWALVVFIQCSGGNG